MNKINKTVATSLTIFSFILLCIVSLFWFLLTYWKFPSYSNSTCAFLENTPSGINWIIIHILYFIAFFPLSIAMIIIFIEFVFLKRKNIILKICFSLILLFTISISIIPFLVTQSNVFISKFNTQNWTNIPSLRYESVQDLEDTYDLIGMSSNQLFSLLGPENYETKNYNAISYYWDLKNPLSHSNEYLKVTMLKNKVISYGKISNSVETEA